MSVYEIPLTRPHIDDEDRRAMNAAVVRGEVAQGGTTTQLEKEIAKHFGAAGAVATNSGSSALILALRTVGVVPGDEVILPSYTCIAVMNAVVQCGCVPRLADNSVDVLAMDYNMSASAVRDKLSPRTAAVIVPHMFGVPLEIEEIVALGVPVVEDITLDVGATSGGRVAGTSGAIAVCSLHESKMIAAGEGGMLVAFHPALAKRARYLNGWEQEQATQRFEEAHSFDYELRYNFHMNGISAALALSQLRKLDWLVARRRELGRLYTDTLSSVEGVVCPLVADTHVFFRYLVSVPRGAPVDALLAFRDAGIEAGRGVYPPLHRFLVADAKAGFVGAEQAAATLVSIPLYPALSDSQVARILEVSVRVLGNLE